MHGNEFWIILKISSILPNESVLYFVWNKQFHGINNSCVNSRAYGSSIDYNEGQSAKRLEVLGLKYLYETQEIVQGVNYEWIIFFNL